MRLKIPRPLRCLVGCLLIGIVLDCACAPQRVVLPTAPASFKPRQELQVWQGREAVTLHGVRITGDSLSGVPVWKPPDCDSCRVGALGVIFALSAGND